MAMISYLTTIRLKEGAVSHLADDMKAAGIAKPLIITDAGVRAAGLLARVLAHLPQGDALPVFDGTPSNPTEEAAEAALALYRTHHCDGLIAIGGGSPMDLAKAVAVMATHEGPLKTYATIEGGSPKITERVAPLIAVPTTSGTGSEVARGAILIVDDGRKLGFHNWHLMPRAAICDPELTLGLPPKLTAATGMDALTHNIESYLSPAYHPLCDGIALEGTRIAAAALLTAVQQPTNLQARSDMMMSSMMGAIAFQKDLGAVHSCAHALGAVLDMHHGLANALMIDVVMAWNYEAVPEKFNELAHVCHVKGGGSAFVPWLQELKLSIGITGNLSSHGVNAEHLARLVEIATADICHQTNPRPCTAADFEKLFKAAM